MTQYYGRSEDSKVDSPVPVIPQLDQYGYFALHTLPPGEYTLSVSEEEQSAAIHTINVGLDEGQSSAISVG